MFSIFAAAVFAVALTTTTSATFNAKSKNNVITYWGQGRNQDRLLTTCQNPSFDIINIAFVDVFPDQGAGGWPGTNFGNACLGDVYQNAQGVNTSLLKTCPDIGVDVTACQQTYGKKIFLSIGGGYPVNYYIKNAASGTNFANFLWAAFGPVSATKKAVPRPWGNATVDGFDFDIESVISLAPQANYQTSGYAAMINQFKNKLFPTDTSKDYYISGAPQCVLPDSHYTTVLQTAWFDFLWIQFYNTPACSARAGITQKNGKDISFANWEASKSLNPNVRMSIGLPASVKAANAASYYLTPAEAQTTIKRFYKTGLFGGVMLWEATYNANNTPCNVDYATWMKSILIELSKGTTANTNTKQCKNLPTKRSLPDSYSTSTVSSPVSESTYWTMTSQAQPAATWIASSHVTSPAAASTPLVNSSAGSSPVAPISTYSGDDWSMAGHSTTATSTNLITATPVPVSSASPAPYPIGPTGGNGTSQGIATASVARASSSAWAVPATGGANTHQTSLIGFVLVVAIALLLV